MDDVLASIRRIVRAEKEPATSAETVDVSPETPPTPAPDGAPATEMEPLALTPDMRLEVEAEAAEAQSLRLQPVPPVVPAAEVPVPEAPTETAPLAPSADELRDLVRAVVQEELKSNAVDGLVRDIIRNELTQGEIGSNISQNVLRLIQSEISKAMK